MFVEENRRYCEDRIAYQRSIVKRESKQSRCPRTRKECCEQSIVSDYIRTGDIGFRT